MLSDPLDTFTIRAVLERSHAVSVGTQFRRQELGGPRPVIIQADSVLNLWPP
jgi:hypothetical protein